MEKTNLVIGKINTGKTTGIMFPEVEQAISNQESLFILDNREEYYKTFKDKLEEHGYTTLVFNLKDASRSNSFNPLRLPYYYYKNGKKDMALELLHILSLEIFKSDNPNVDPFWENSAANYFMALVLILFKEAKEEEINLASVQIMLSGNTQKNNGLSVVRKYFDCLSVLDNIYIVGSPVVYAPVETKGSIVAVMRQSLNAYCMREQLLNNLSGNEIDFSDLPLKTAIFVIGNATVRNLGNIVIDQAVDSNKEFTFILDNIGDMSKILRVEKLLDDKMKTYIVVRDRNILEDIYGKFIISKFECVVENFKVDICRKVGTSDEYPAAKSNDIVYFDLEALINADCVL